MNGEEDIQNHIGRNHRLIKNDLGNLGVTGATAADAFVIGVLGVTTRVTNHHIGDASELHVRRIKAPETAATKHKFSHGSSLGWLHEL